VYLRVGVHVGDRQQNTADTAQGVSNEAGIGTGFGTGKRRAFAAELDRRSQELETRAQKNGGMHVGVGARSIRLVHTKEVNVARADRVQL
jgi:hypothetical protein